MSARFHPYLCGRNAAEWLISMRKRMLAAEILLQVLCIFIFSCGKCENNLSDTEAGPRIYIDYEKSFFNDFYIEENYVIFECKYTIVSEENEPKNIKMEGEFREDREGGLITEELLKATDKETGDDVFEIFPGENRIIVLYTAAHGTEMVKQNRLLPETRIYCI